MPAYYNDSDPHAAKWLRSLVAADLIAPGEVDERPIQEVQPHELSPFQQVHLFAGIGGWSYALRLAGVSDDSPVWTGSCPCQPFSSAGRQRAEGDDRHLWPYFRHLVAECRPPVVLGEQVASPLGRRWLSRVRADLEELGYGVGAADLCAAGVASPQERQRLFWAGALGHAGSQGLEERTGNAGIRGEALGARPREAALGAGPHGFWAKYDIVTCRNPLTGAISYRRVEPGTFPLADGVPARVAKLRGLGNAIVPQVAAVFVSALLSADQPKEA